MLITSQSTYRYSAKTFAPPYSLFEYPQYSDDWPDGRKGHKFFFLSKTLMATTALLTMIDGGLLNSRNSILFLILCAMLTRRLQGGRRPKGSMAIQGVDRQTGGAVRLTRPPFVLTSEVQYSLEQKSSISPFSFFGSIRTIQYILLRTVIDEVAEDFIK